VEVVIEGLEMRPDADGDAGLHRLLVDVLGGPDARGRVLEQTRLAGHRTVRWRFQLDGGERSLVVKRLPLEGSLRERAAITRWLPRAGFSHHTARFLGVAVHAGFDHAWHVYEDLGDRTLAQVPLDLRSVHAAVALIARIHLHFAANPLLAECRLIGRDFGAAFLVSSVEDGLRGLDAVRRREGLPDAWRDLVERLLHRLALLRAELPGRLRSLDELAWPETLLHGDLWHTNIVVPPGAAAPDIRLIDWEYAGVGPALYDLSTLLRRLPPQHRRGVLDTYQACTAVAGWSWPDDAALNRVAETMELGRYANTIVWSAMDVLQAAPAVTPDWAFEDLADNETWFDDLTPLLPPPGDAHGEDRAA
jgi:hypothetical protein